MQRLALVVTAIAVLSVGCKDQRILQPPASAGPAYLISDGAHSGNANFFFLPPLVPDPSAFFHAGTFNSALSPVVDVCTLSDDPRLHPAPPDPGAASCVGSPVFGPATMALDLTSQQYTLNWDTKSPTLLDATKFYRIFVRGAASGTALGSLDVDPVDQGLKNLKTGDVVQFQDGRTIPIKVRIEQGAFGSTNPDHVEQVVPNNITSPTGTLDVTTNTFFAGGRFSNNWLPVAAVAAGIDQVVVIIERIPGTNCLQSGLLELEGCYRFRTDPDLHRFGTFNVNVIVGVCFQMPIHTDAPFQLQRREEDAEGTPTGATVPLEDAEAPFLMCDTFAATPPSPLGALRSGRLLEFASAGWQALARGVGRLVMPQALYAVDLGAGGSTDGFSRFGYARGATMVKVAATDNQVAVTGTKVLLDPTVCLTRLHPSLRPLVSEPVTFAVTSGGGTVGGGASVIVNTDTETGCAHAQWILGTTPGQNSLLVTALADGSPQTFTATGLGTLVVRPLSTGLTAQGVSLPLTQTSGLSMQDNTGVQLEVSPATAVTWSSSDPTGNKASVNTTGLLAVVQGNDDPNTANGGIITATGATAVGSIKVNSFSFDHFPRLTTLVWRPVTGAATYDVFVEFANGCTAGTANCTTWAPLLSTTTPNLGLVFQFVGAQPGRWHVVANDASGAVISTSELVYFVYVI
ncbi:MAG: hypothetical protein AUH78_14085 [Gemmatimonadetes bacterium 13_1_40CM_4_69_8]|nr:MAG: hypothetical protein AUH78_14085 [Gemmatimonadetes bacterium 13_1_40CM_4_69_8]